MRKPKGSKKFGSSNGNKNCCGRFREITTRCKRLNHKIHGGNVLIIKKMLRHESIQNTMKYVHTIEFKEEGYEETVATTLEEVRQLGKGGWQNMTK